MAPELSAKRLEVLQEMVPRMSRVAALWDPTTGASQVETTERAARSLNLSIQVLEVRGRNDIVDAFRKAQSNQADAVNVFNSPVLSSLYREIIDLSAEHRLATMYQWKEHVEAGGLLSYGEPHGDVAAGRNDCCQSPQRCEACRPPSRANARTAKALGIAIPPSVLVRADDVFE